MSKVYTVTDVVEAEYTLEPLVCVHCGSEEVVYSQAVADGKCQSCGRWQLEDDE